MLALRIRGIRADEPAAGLARLAPVTVLRLADGRFAALAGITVPADLAEVATAAERAVADWLGQGPFALAAVSAMPDRHGRWWAVPMRDGEALQARLVGDGLAIVAPEAGAGVDDLRAWLALEAGARDARRGVWASRAHGPHEAEAVPPSEGRFVLVEGRIARIARTTMFWYANFGRSLRRDFTFRIPIAAEDPFAQGGLDLASLGQRRIRVRGWLFEDNGPMIEITHPLALEMLP